MGIENICAVDGNQQRLDFAKRMGATMSVNFMEHKGIEALSEAVKDQFGGHLADLHSSVQDHLLLMQTSTNSSVTAVAFASLVSSSMVEMLQLTRTLTSAPKRSQS